jgi:hypothetical protein
MIIEIGNHQKLMEKEGHYCDLVNKQMGIWNMAQQTKKEEVLIEVVT